MLKVVLTLAVLLVAIYAQDPPSAAVPCVSYVNSTASAFCAAAVTYRVSNTTDYASTIAAATTNYNSNLALIANATDACKAALAVYSCRQSFPRCAGGGIQFTNPNQTTCNAVNVACGITNFPSITSNFTGIQCTTNSLASVEGPTYVCIPTNTVGLGSTCGNNVFDANIPTPTTIASNDCVAVSSCNTTAATQTCVRPSVVGDACSSDSGCVSNPYSGSFLGSVGSTLTCISGRCSYGGRRYPSSCVVNGECLSNNCTAGVCQESNIGGPCTNSNGCRPNLYCDTKNSTCYSLAQGGEVCGFLQSNWDLVPCLSGFTCVRANNATTFATCKPNANVGQQCSSVTGIVKDAPSCNPISNDGVVTCENNVCRVPSLGVEGAVCNETARCNPLLTCKYPTSTSTQGTCAQPNTVACANTYGNNCNDLQRCTCGADLSQTGTCSVDTTNPRISCTSQIIALTTCQVSKCNSAPFVAYEANSCVTNNCITELNAFYCCAKTKTGSNFVSPVGMPSEPCATPSPTPGPTTPTSTGTPVPIQSSKRSSASTVAVNLIALILAVVAFL